jgi:fatty acid elongase 3
MYLYYALVASGRPPWWKQLVTILQIAQFIVDVVVCWWGIATHHLDPRNCTGDVTTSWFGAVLLSSYLGLFIDFYINTYLRKPESPKRAVRLHPKKE